MYSPGRVWQQCKSHKKLIEGDDELFMLHHYLQRGIPPEHILALSPAEQAFYMASCMLAMETRSPRAGERRGL